MHTRQQWRVQQIREIEPGDPAATLARLNERYEPAVLRGLVRDWPAVRAGTPEALRDYLARFDKGATADTMVAPPAAGGRFFYQADAWNFNFTRHKAPFAALMRDLAACHADAPTIFAGALETAQMLPGFTAENALPLLDGLDAVQRIWVGNRSVVSTHFDGSDNIACVVAGRRRFTLFPPDQAPNLYVGPLDRTVSGQPTSMVELNNPDFARYPRFREALAVACFAELDPGDAIYIPAMWWHQVDALAPFNVLVNHWWQDSPDQFARFDAMIYAAMAIGHLPPERRAAWETMFDTFVFRNHGDPVAHLPRDQPNILDKPTPPQRAYIRGYLARNLSRP